MTRASVDFFCLVGAELVRGRSYMLKDLLGLALQA